MNMRSIVPFSWGSCVGHGDHHWHNLAGLGSRHNGASKLGLGGVQGDGDSGPAAISTDGRFIAFDSSASNLMPATSTAGRTCSYATARRAQPASEPGAGRRPK